MNLELLETFVQIVKYKQISRAAESLFITQAAASNRLRKLESQLGVKLINRIKGQSTISTTPYGDRLLVIAQQLISLSHDVQTLKENAEYSKIKIASTTNVIEAALSFIIPQVMKDDPLLRFTLKESSTFEVYESITNNSADIGFSFTNAPRYGLNTRQIGNQPLTLITSQQNKIPDQIDIDSLSPSNEVYIPYNEQYDQWHMICWGNQIDPYIKLDSCSSFSHFLDHEKTWAIIPKSLAQQYIDYNFPIKEVRLIEPIPKLPIIAIDSLTNPYKKKLDDIILRFRSFLV